MTKRIAMTVLGIVCFAVPACEKTTVEGPQGKKLTLVKPSDSTIKRGATEKVKIVVARENFTGPVTVRFDQLPKGVTVADGGNEIEGNNNDRTFVFQASDTADLVQNHSATVTASGPNGISATENFKITIKEKS